MGQEQKPFEVMTGVVVLGQEYSLKIFAKGKADLFAVLTAAKIIAKYAINANAEIRRLQGNELLHQSEIKLFQNAASQHCKEIANLKQRLADAPTWGKWVDATVENLESASAGVFEIEQFSGETEIAFMFDGIWYTESGSMDDGTVRTNYLQFRRLNYTPKPAREVEKTYKHFGRQIPLQEFADDETWCPSIREIAADFIAEKERHAAAQAELRELKDKS